MQVDVLLGGVGPGLAFPRSATILSDTPTLAERFEVRSIPTALLFKGGELLRRIQPHATGELKAAVASELGAQ